MITLVGPAATNQELHNKWCCNCRGAVTVCNGCLHEAALRCHILHVHALLLEICLAMLRQFTNLQVLRFWEALWSNPHHEHFHLFVCVAVLEHHRRAIMNSCQDFDDLLKFCVELSGRIPMTSVLQDADALCKWAGDAGLDCVAELTPVQTK